LILCIAMEEREEATTDGERSPLTGQKWAPSNPLEPQSAAEQMESRESSKEKRSRAKARLAAAVTGQLLRPAVKKESCQKLGLEPVHQVTFGPRPSQFQAQGTPNSAHEVDLPGGFPDPWARSTVPMKWNP
jgi:hypothetical protein